jgi:hypothetical protein
VRVTSGSGAIEARLGGLGVGDLRERMAFQLLA